MSYEKPHAADGGDDAPLHESEWETMDFKQFINDFEWSKDNDAVASLRMFYAEQDDGEQMQDEVDALANTPFDSEDRQIQLCRLYSLESSLYHEMNAALRNDDGEMVEKLAPYIWELREVFETDHENQIIDPFAGTVYRAINFDDPQTALKPYNKDEKFAWAAFTSTSTDREGTLAGGFGNVVFEIKCYPLEGAYDDDKPEWAPAPISQWSDFPNEAEVLFPPYTEFRVVNIMYPSDDNDLLDYGGDIYCMVQCETTAFPSIYGMIDAGDKDGVQAWADQNPDRVKTDDCAYSIVHAAIDKEEKNSRTRGIDFEDPDDDSMTTILVDAGANPNEACRSTGSSVRDKLPRKGCIQC